MKSVVIRRYDEGHPIWQKDYELFMGNLGFNTKLCKPRQPFTKGSVLSALLKKISWQDVSLQS